MSINAPGKERKIKLHDILPDPIIDHDGVIYIITQLGYIVRISNPSYVISFLIQKVGFS